MKCMTFFTILMAGLALCSLTGCAGNGEEKHTISVTGVAVIEVSPDYVQVETSIITLDKDLEKAQKENDKKTKAVLSFIRAHGLGPEDVATEHVFLKPKHTSRHYDMPPVFEGYEASKTITVRLAELESYDRLISGMLHKGVNQVNYVYFGNSSEVQRRKEARCLALEAAKEKAGYLAAKVGMKVGKPIAVTEAGAGMSRWWSGGGEASSLINVVTREERPETDPDMEQGTLAPHQITIRAQVDAIFELVD